MLCGAACVCVYISFTVCSVQYAHDRCQYRPCTEDSALPYMSFAVCGVQYAHDRCQYSLVQKIVPCLTYLSLCAVYSMHMTAVSTALYRR